jgi:hypothetical protein
VRRYELKEDDYERTGLYFREGTSAEMGEPSQSDSWRGWRSHGTGLLLPNSAHAGHEDDDRGCRGPRINPIPGGGAPFKPFGVIVHHNPLNPAVALPDISDPSQITDFDGFVGLTHIQGGGTGTDTTTGVTAPLAYRADMGFARGKFIGSDGQPHRGTFAFV